jgi:hypothetical protein
VGTSRNATKSAELKAGEFPSAGRMTAYTDITRKWGTGPDRRLRQELARNGSQNASGGQDGTGYLSPGIAAIGKLSLYLLPLSLHPEVTPERVVESPSTTPTRCDGAEGDQSGCLSGRVSDPGLVQAYCVFSGGDATFEAAAAPSGGLVSGSAKNLPTICATSGELMKL